MKPPVTITFTLKRWQVYAIATVVVLNLLLDVLNLILRALTR